MATTATRLRRCTVEERRLADAGWSIDHEHAPFRTPRGSDRSFQHGQLLCPLE
jgi:hypothetical protein